MLAMQDLKRLIEFNLGVAAEEVADLVEERHRQQAVLDAESQTRAERVAAIKFHPAVRVNDTEAQVSLCYGKALTLHPEKGGKWWITFNESVTTEELFSILDRIRT